MAISVIVHGAEPCSDPAKRRITFDAPRIVVGRASSCDVRLPDASVSLRHLTIKQRGSKFAIVDEGSTNGTFVGRTKLSPQAPEAIGDHALVRAGRFVLELVVSHDRPTPQPAAAAKELALALVIEQLLAEGEDARPRVVVESGPDAGTELLLEAGERATVGRSRDASLALTDGATSRRHVEIVWRGDGIFARDLGSKSGSSLGERALGANDTAWRLSETLTLGETTLAAAFDAPDAIGEIERAPDARTRASEIDLRRFEPAQTEAESDDERVMDVADDDDDDATTDAESGAESEAASSPERHAPQRRGTSWSVTDVAVVLLALGVFSLSAVGYVVLLR